MRSPVHLILTVDYELFGNGRGCIDRCVIDPADQMMCITQDFSAPITFLVEVTEFIAMEAEGAPVDRMRKQLAQAVAQGHDAQLHVHPQWEHATELPDGIWRVDNDRWRIGDLPFANTLRLLRMGKEWLEDVVNVEDYRVLAFRAGGLCIQPSTVVIRALSELGFLVDSTVAPGFRNTAHGEWSDFRSVPKMPYWKSDSDVCSAVASGLWEVPIVAGRIAPWRHLRTRTVKSRRLYDDGTFAYGCRGSYRGPDGGWGRLKGKLGKVMRLGHVMLDFSTMPVDVLADITQQWMNRYGYDAKALPLVAIAHTKNFTSDSEKHLAGYLAWAKDQGIQFSTYGKWLEAVGE